MRKPTLVLTALALGFGVASAMFLWTRPWLHGPRTREPIARPGTQTETRRSPLVSPPPGLDPDGQRLAAQTGTSSGAGADELLAGILPESGDEQLAGTPEALVIPQSRINRQIQILSGESLKQSVANLHEVEMYYWPGGGVSNRAMVGLLPLPECDGQETVDAILSNRRFAKVLAELSVLPATEAGELVTRELRASLGEYEGLLKAHLSNPRLRAVMGPDKRPISTGGYQVSNNPDGSPTLQGARHKVLGLTLAAGVLGLASVRGGVQDVVYKALEQRKEFSDGGRYNIPMAVSLLGRASVYNRQILATALLGTSNAAARPADTGDSLVTWKEVDLAVYDSRATAYDLHARSGVAAVDYSRGSIPVRYVAPISDAQFDRVMGSPGSGGVPPGTDRGGRH